MIPDRPDEAGRVEAARAGEARALAWIYEEHGEDLYRLAYRLTASAADAEDVLHDVFLGLPEALRTFAGTGSLRGWLRMVATRTALMKLRRRKRRREVRLSAGSRPGRRGRPPVVDRLFLERLLATLPDHERTVLILKEVEGLSHDAIGEILGITPGASRQRLHRARLRLRRLAGEEERP